MTVDADRTIRHVVVPLDGSPFSETALPTAVHLAHKLDADLHLLSAVDTVQEEPERRARLAAIPVGGRPVAVEVVVSRDPAGAIHETLRRLPGSVACMASHARVHAAALTHSVLTELLVRGRDSVIAVGPAIGDYAPWLEHQRREGVVVGVDDNDEAPRLVQVAADCAVQLHERLTILTVAEPVPPPLAVGPVHRRYGPDGDVDLFLRALVSRIHRDDVELETRALYDPVSAVDGVVTWVREHASALVVVGTEAPTGLKRFVKGTTAAAIVRSSAAPVLVVPAAIPQAQNRAAAGRRSVVEPAR